LDWEIESTSIEILWENTLNDVSVRFDNGRVFWCPCQRPFGFFVTEGIPSDCPFFLEHVISQE
jgi:hypothetical protein